MSARSFSLGISPASLCSVALIITMTRIRGSSLSLAFVWGVERAARKSTLRAKLEAELLGEDLLHPLVGAAADRAEAGVAHRTADLEIPARQPESLLRDLVGGPLREELGLGHLAQGVLAAGEEPQSVVGQAARGLELHRHLRDGVAIPHRLDDPLQHALHRGDCAQRHDQPLPLEVGHDQVEAAVLLAEQVLLRHEHVAERQLGRVGRPPAELLELARDLEALHVALEDQERKAVVPTLFRRLHRGDDEVGPHAVRDERLRPVHHVAAVHAPGEGADAGHVRPGARLRDPERGDPLAPDRGRQEALLLIVGPELGDRRRGDAHVGADPGRHAPGPAARQLLAEHRVVGVVAATAAVLARVLQAEQAELPHPLEDLVGEPAGALPLARMGAELARNELANLSAQRLVAFTEGRCGGPVARRGDAGWDRAHFSVQPSSPHSGSSFSIAPPSAPSIARVIEPPRSSSSRASRKWRSSTRAEPARAACSAALRTSSRRNAGLTPSVSATMAARSVSARSRPRPNRSMRSERACASGKGNATAWSTRPGRDASAGSSRSARLVVMTKITSASSPIPSISFKSRNSSEVAPKPIAVRSWATRSTSSSTTIAGWRSRAIAQASPISPRAAPRNAARSRPCAARSRRARPPAARSGSYPPAPAPGTRPTCPGSSSRCRP